MPEWSIGAVSKTVVPFWNRGFESLSFRAKSCKPNVYSSFLFNV